MIIGFTGSRKGMTSAQKFALGNFLRMVKESEATQCSVPSFVHGDCVGADFEASLLASDLGFFVIARPCTLWKQRGYTNWNNRLHPAKEPLARNRDIVKQCNILVACPATKTDRLRSGTWYTIRWARATNRTTVMLYP